MEDLRLGDGGGVEARRWLEAQERLAELRLIDRAIPVRPTDAIAAVDA